MAPLYIPSLSLLLLCILLFSSISAPAEAFMLLGRRNNNKPDSRGNTGKGSNGVQQPIEPGSPESAKDESSSISTEGFSASSSSSPTLSSPPSGLAQRFYRGGNPAGVAAKKEKVSLDITKKNSILKCKFVTGDSKQDNELPSFFIPTGDKQIYELGVKEILSQMSGGAKAGGAVGGRPGATSEATVNDDGSRPPSLSIECEEVQAEVFPTVDCRLCIYNEVSQDRKHLRQGQVLDTKLKQCMDGEFLNGGKMNESTYHPICYPPEAEGGKKGITTTN